MNELFNHTYPCIDITAAGCRYNFNPPGMRCPHCDAPSNCIGVTTYPGYRVVHCAICGWSDSKNAREVAPLEFRRQSRGNLVDPMPDKNNGPCECCGTNPHADRSRFCIPCQKKRQQEAQRRHQARLKGEQIPDMRVAENRTRGADAVENGTALDEVADTLAGLLADFMDIEQEAAV